MINDAAKLAAQLEAAKALDLDDLAKQVRLGRSWPLTLVKILCLRLPAAKALERASQAGAPGVVLRVVMALCWCWCFDGSGAIMHFCGVSGAAMTLS